MPSLVRRILSWPYNGLCYLARLLAAAFAALGDGVDYLLALGRSPSQVALQWPEQKPQFRGRVAIFAHDDRLGRVGDYVLAHLAGLREAGCEILFVSNAGKLTEHALASLKPLCGKILVRKSWGGKWGAWREGLRCLGSDTPVSLLLLVDDSTYGPLTPIGALIGGLDFGKTDVWGLTESWQDRWHLQTYFLAVHPTVLENPGWAKFWDGCLPLRSRRLIYRRGEIGFSQAMLRAGVHLQTKFSHKLLCEHVDRTPIETEEPESMRARLRYIQLQQIDTLIAGHRPFDPTQILWRQLLQLGHPYFSRDLLRKNPEKVRDLFDWTSELEHMPSWDVSLIDEDLAASSRTDRPWRNFLRPIKGWYLNLRAFARTMRDEFSRLRSMFRSHRQARFVWPHHKVECGPRVVVFVHFDKYGLVRDYVLQYLHALRGIGASILFVSNSGKLQPEAIESLKPLCLGIIVRDNFGYDFGAWREGLEYLKGSLDNLEWLALANDSVYGPLVPLQPVFNHLDFTKADVWGFTDSEQRNWHLQSYFIAVSRRVLRSRAWREFWQHVHPVQSKSWAISNGELKFTEVLQNAGFDCAALFPYKNLVTQLDPVKRIANRGANPFIRLRLRHRHNLTHAIDQGYALNPTADLWRQLLRQGFPFLKRELLRSNPSGVPDSLDWQAEVAATSGADVQLIEEDLRKSVRGRVA